MTQKRIYTIDIARAISIILVVTGHFQPEGSPSWWMSFYDVLHTFRMPLFLAVSGYTYIYLLNERKDKQRTYKNFVLHKFQRLMIPYFFISVFIIGTKLLFGGNSAAENPVSYASFYEMFYTPAAGPFVWFVYVLFFIFLIIPHFNTRKGLTILFAISLILHFIPIAMPLQLEYLRYFKSMLVFFVAGCLFYEWRSLRTLIMNTNFFIFVAFFVVFYVMAVMSNANQFISSLWGFMASLFGAIMIVKFAKFISEKEKIQQVFLSVAACSYTIYLFHTTSEGFAKAVFGRLHLGQYIGYNLSFILEAIVVISFGVIAPLILHHIITRKSKIFSYLIGANYKNNKRTRSDK